MTDIYIIECIVNNYDNEGIAETYVETGFGYFTDEAAAELCAATATEKENHEKFVSYLKGVKKINEASQVRYEADLKIYDVLKESGVTGQRLERFNPATPYEYKAYRFEEWVKMHGFEYTVTCISEHKD